jgi:hypothetical protein
VFREAHRMPAASSSLHDHLGSELGLGHCGQCTAWPQLRLRLVDDRNHEG